MIVNTFNLVQRNANKIFASQALQLLNGNNKFHFFNFNNKKENES